MSLIWLYQDVLQREDCTALAEGSRGYQAKPVTLDGLS
jgi:hypothetical protein